MLNETLDSLLFSKTITIGLKRSSNNYLNLSDFKIYKLAEILPEVEMKG
jgi:hypothetical protein